MKKRIIVLLLILAMMVSMTACGSILGGLMNRNKKPSSQNAMSNMFEGLEDMMEDIPSMDIVEDFPVMEAPADTVAPTEAPEEEWVIADDSYELEDYICGTWLRETMYLEHYGCDADMYTTFNHDNSAYQLLLRHDNGDILNESAGEWWFEGDEVVLQKNGENSKIRFQYFESTQRLKNGDRYYTKID